jgi:hypothetical protein
MSLNIADNNRAREDHQGENLDENLVPVAAAEGRPRLNQHNHFFHFDGELFSTYKITLFHSFLPSGEAVWIIHCPIQTSLIYFNLIN